MFASTAFKYMARWRLHSNCSDLVVQYLQGFLTLVNFTLETQYEHFWTQNQMIDEFIPGLAVYFLIVEMSLYKSIASSSKNSQDAQFAA